MELLEKDFVNLLATWAHRLKLGVHSPWIKAPLEEALLAFVKVFLQHILVFPDWLSNLSAFSRFMGLFALRLAKNDFHRFSRENRGRAKIRTSGAKTLYARLGLVSYSKFPILVQVKTKVRKDPIFHTRQLPMGAGHCPWGGFTDWNVCNIHREPIGQTVLPF